MKKKLFLIITLSCIGKSEKLYASSWKDSSAIYYTKEQFANNSGQLNCKCRIKEKAYPFWSDFDFEASGLIRIKLSNKNFQNFKPGSIYGFILNGIKFRYLFSEKKYLAVLKNSFPIAFFVKEDERVGYKYIYKNGVILYLNYNTGKIKEFTKKNIAADFGSNPSMFQKMSSLLNQLKKYKGNISRKNFFKCKKIIHEYFN